MNVSSKALTALKKTEGFSATAYKDGMVSNVQMYSIGYGHQIRATEQSLKRATITVAQADAILKADIKPIELQINAVGYKLNQNQFDALFSFGYNTGSGALAKVLTTLKTTRDMSKVTAHMAQYTHTTVDGNKVRSSALEQRRAAEITLFNKPYVPVLAIIAVSAALLFIR